MTELVIATIITLYANLYGVPSDYALCVAQAESRLDPAAIGDSGRAGGLWQFHEPFWREMRAEMGRDADPALRFDVAESTETAMYAMRRGYWQRWSTDCQCQALRAPVDTTVSVAGGVDTARDMCYSDGAEAKPHVKLISRVFISGIICPCGDNCIKPETETARAFPGETNDLTFGLSNQTRRYWECSGSFSISAMVVPQKEKNREAWRRPVLHECLTLTKGWAGGIIAPVRL